MSDGTHGHGTTLAGATAGTIGNIQNIAGPTIQVDDIDISSMDSTNKWREFIPGMKDAGELVFTVNYDGSASGNADALNTAIGVVDTWTVTFSDGSTWACSGYLKNLGTTSEFEGKITQDVTIKLSGAPTYTDVA